MKWFKFYGQDFLTDPKMRLLSPEEKLCWITLMCLANSEDKNGDVNFIKEEEILFQSGIEFDSPSWHEALGFINKFEELHMLQVRNKTVTGSNNISRYDVTLTNFSSRQNENLSNAERQKKYRETHKNEAKTPRNNRNTSQRNDSNAREEEIRGEKNREETNTNVLVKKVSLYELDDLFFAKIAENYQVPLSFVRSKYDDMVNWHEEDPKKNNKLNWNATLRNWVKRDAVKISQQSVTGGKRVAIQT